MYIIRITGKELDEIRRKGRTELYREKTECNAGMFMGIFGTVWVERKQKRYVIPDTTGQERKPIELRAEYGKQIQRIWAECSLSAGYGREEWGAEPEKEYYILKIEDIGGLQL